MIVDLDKASFIVVSGSKVQLHFQDTSVHVRRFSNRRELSAILNSWEHQTRNLRGHVPETDPRR